RSRVLTDTSSTFTLADAHPFGRHKNKKRKLEAELHTSSVNSPILLQNAATTSTNQNNSLKPVEQVVNINKEQQQQPEHTPSRSGTSSTSTQSQDSTTTKGQTYVADSHTSDIR